MPSLLPGYEYDIFISYRHNDNRSGWVTEFVKALQEELAATIKEPVSVYFDVNPHDGLHDNYDVDDSLQQKLKCLLLIPIVSRTYCDPNSFAWQKEFKSFVAQASQGQLGLKVKLQNGNTSIRVLPIRIHELEPVDVKLFETEINAVLRAIDFVFKSAGVNRPLQSTDKKEDNAYHTIYRDQINKVANAIEEIISAIRNPVVSTAGGINEQSNHPVQRVNKKMMRWVSIVAFAFLIMIGAGYFIFQRTNSLKKPADSGLAILPFTNNTGSADLDYYGVGMASEVRTKISQTNQFNFISSLQATLPYIKTQKSTKEIGEDLKVDFILAGLYQKAGNRIKIEVELLDAETGKLIWTLPLERDLNDIFDVQREIAQAVLSRFSILTTAATTKPTQNLAAYSLFLQGIELKNQSNSPDSSKLKSIELFKMAIALDSLYADAWANLMDTKGFMYSNSAYTDEKEIELKRYKDYVVDHFPGAWQKDIVEGIYAYRVLKKFKLAEESFQKVLAQDKQNLMALELLSALYKRQFDFSLAIKFCKAALTINPTSGATWGNLAEILGFMGNTNSALKAALKSWELTHSESSAMDAYDAAAELKQLNNLPENLKSKIPNFEILKKLNGRDYRGIINSPIKEKKDNLIGLTSLAYFLLNKEDSARYFVGQLIQRKSPGMVALALAGKREMAFAVKDSYWKRSISTGDDKFSIAREKFLTILLLSLLKEYSEATKVLIQLNRELPEYGGYDSFSLPYFDRIKKEYPPFQEALNSISRQPMIDVEEFIKF